MSGAGEVVEMPSELRYGADGLIPVVAQDWSSGDVLMVAFANAEAVALTARTGEAHFWSRSRSALWKKGETSGNLLAVREARADCDRDTLLWIVDPVGPACHTGARSCFGDTSPTAAGILDELRRVIEQRKAARPDGSYTARLLDKGLDHVLKKVGEESTEVVLAAKAESEARLAEEVADLLFHVSVALCQRETSMTEALDVLKTRRADR